MISRLAHTVAIILAVTLLVAGCPTGQPDTTAPGEVTGFRADAGDSLVVLEWTDPDDHDLAMVRIQATPGDGTVYNVPAGVQTRTVYGLANGVEYSFTARAFDAAGNGSAGVTVHAVPAAGGLPSDPGTVYVRSGGDDSNSGSTASPKRTIQAAIDAAVAQNKAAVRVAEGVYAESLLLAAGVSVFGGYGPDFSSRDPAVHPSHLLGVTATSQRPGAVNAVGISGGEAGSVTVDGFVIRAADASAAGSSSYGVYLSDCDASVAVTSSVVYGGSGAPGSAGLPGSDGSAGAAGSAGLDSIDLYDTYGVEHGSADHLLQGGSGGVFVAGGVTVSGGNGGLRMPPSLDPVSGFPVGPDSGSAGYPGANSGGNGGSAGWDVYHEQLSCQGYQVYGDLEGGNGASGAEGADGVAGAPSGAGAVAAGLWQAGAGGTGGNGQPGGGGGGGGSGAGAYTHSSCFSAGYGTDNVGPSGGGGGSGGAPGTAGTGGGSGGGSFAVFVLFSSAPASLPGLSGNLIHGGSGGSGAHGGSGGSGGAAGDGAAGGTGTPADTDARFPSFDAGAGGDGGRGGHGGGGGGGNGGPSWCIYAHGAAGAASWTGLNTLVAGTGGAAGAGGLSLGNAGAAGSAGSAGTVNF